MGLQQPAVLPTAAVSPSGSEETSEQVAVHALSSSPRASVSGAETLTLALKRKLLAHALA